MTKYHTTSHFTFSQTYKSHLAKLTNNSKKVFNDRFPSHICKIKTKCKNLSAFNFLSLFVQDVHTAISMQLGKSSLDNLIFDEKKFKLISFFLNRTAFY